MFKKLKAITLSLSALLILVAPAVVMADVTQSDINSNLACGSNGSFGSDCNANLTDNGNRTMEDTVKTVINIISIVVAAVAVIMLMIGGFRYVTSGGKQESVTGAKNTIMYAIIGLVIVALAQIIVQFVLNKATNS
jgi:lysylphosphatidylglycerol synthetase-like protein (DUF2156 family)